MAQGWAYGNKSRDAAMIRKLKTKSNTAESGGKCCRTFSLVFFFILFFPTAFYGAAWWKRGLDMIEYKIQPHFKFKMEELPPGVELHGEGIPELARVSQVLLPFGPSRFTKPQENFPNPEDDEQPDVLGLEEEEGLSPKERRLREVRKKEADRKLALKKAEWQKNENRLTGKVAFFVGLNDGRMGRLVRTDNASLPADHTGLQFEEILRTGNTQYLNPLLTCGEMRLYSEFMCGFPNGMALDQDGIRLYVVDTNNGLFMVDLEKNSKDLLVEKDSKETRFQYLRDVAVSKKTGKLYFTQSTDAMRHNTDDIAVMAGDANGAVFMYDPAMEVGELLAGKFQFASGVAVLESPTAMDDNFVLVAERSHARIRKVVVKEQKADDNVKTAKRTYKKEAWLSKLPCHPTSLQWDRSDIKNPALLVGCKSRTAVSDGITKWPSARAALSYLPPAIKDAILGQKNLILRIPVNTKGNPIQNSVTAWDTGIKGYGEISLSVYQATDDEEEGGQVAEDRVAVSVENVPGVLLIPLDKNARRQAERRRAKDLNKQQKKNKGEL